MPRRPRPNAARPCNPVTPCPQAGYWGDPSTGYGYGGQCRVCPTVAPGDAPSSRLTDLAAPAPQTSCSACSAGSYLTGGQASPAACTGCPEGRAPSGAADTACGYCQAGYGGDSCISWWGAAPPASLRRPSRPGAHLRAQPGKGHSARSGPPGLPTEPLPRPRRRAMQHACRNPAAPRPAAARCSGTTRKSQPRSPARPALRRATAVSEPRGEGAGASVSVTVPPLGPVCVHGTAPLQSSEPPPATCQHARTRTPTPTRVNPHARPPHACARRRLPRRIHGPRLHRPVPELQDGQRPQGRARERRVVRDYSFPDPG